MEHIGGIRLVSIDQLVEEIIIMILSSMIGDWLDRNTRQRGLYEIFKMFIIIYYHYYLFTINLKLLCRPKFEYIAIPKLYHISNMSFQYHQIIIIYMMNLLAKIFKIFKILNKIFCL